MTFRPHWAASVFQFSRTVCKIFFGFNFLKTNCQHHVMEEMKNENEQSCCADWLLIIYWHATATLKILKDLEGDDGQDSNLQVKMENGSASLEFMWVSISPSHLDCELLETSDSGNSQ
ncbi:Caspase Activity And Apoptosis Inhibitor 1 [Manis pentadactyla]|nr:Caspase Activity And Apoptosis Inhibitor 1 [Manis pentadactyla]